MADDRIKISGDEFVRKILAGERDFVRIELPSGFKLFATDAMFAELDSNLRSAAGGRLDLRGASLVGLHAPKIYLSHANATCADFSSANLYLADLTHARFGDACFNYANMRGVDLSYSDIACASMIETDLTGVKGLNTMLNLGLQLFSGNEIDPENARILAQAQYDQWLPKMKKWMR